MIFRRGVWLLSARPLLLRSAMCADPSFGETHEDLWARVDRWLGLFWGGRTGRPQAASPSAWVSVVLAVAGIGLDLIPSCRCSSAGVAGPGAAVGR